MLLQGGFARIFKVSIIYIYIYINEEKKLDEALDNMSFIKINYMIYCEYRSFDSIYDML